MIRNSAWIRFALGVTALTLLAGCGSTTPVAGPEAAAPKITSDVPDAVLPHDGPCAGTQLDLPAKLSGLRVNAPVLIPNSNRASFANLTQLWACASGGYVAVFASGVEVVALPGYEGVSNATKWPGYVESNGYGSVAKVHGAPGAVEEPDADHTGLAQVILNGWLIQVLGDSKIPANDLIQVADTM